MTIYSIDEVSGLSRAAAGRLIGHALVPPFLRFVTDNMFDVEEQFASVDIRTSAGGTTKTRGLQGRVGVRWS